MVKVVVRVRLGVGVNITCGFGTARIRECTTILGLRVGTRARVLGLG